MPSNAGNGYKVCQTVISDLNDQPPMNLNFTYFRGKKQSHETNRDVPVNTARKNIGHQKSNRNDRAAEFSGMSRVFNNANNGKEFTPNGLGISSTVNGDHSPEIHGILSRHDMVAETIEKAVCQNIGFFKRDVRFMRAFQQYLKDQLDVIEKCAPANRGILRMVCEFSEEDFAAASRNSLKFIYTNSILKTIKNGQKLSLLVISTKTETKSLCLINSEFYRPSLAGLTNACQKLLPGEILPNALMAVRKIKDSTWHRAVPYQSSWCLLDEAKMIPNTGADHVVVCPLEFANIKFFSFEMATTKKVLKDVPYIAEVQTLDIAQGVMSVAVTNEDYGISFLGELKVWIPKNTSVSRANAAGNRAIKSAVSTNCTAPANNSGNQATTTAASIDSADLELVETRIFPNLPNNQPNIQYLPVARPNNRTNAPIARANVQNNAPDARANVQNSVSAARNNTQNDAPIERADVQNNTVAAHANVQNRPIAKVNIQNNAPVARANNAMPETARDAGDGEQSAKKVVQPAVELKILPSVCTTGEHIRMSIVGRRKQGLVCLLGSSSTEPKYRSLFGEFSAACEGEEEQKAPQPGRMLGVRAVEDGMWYRAVALPAEGGWILLDDGRTLAPGLVNRVVYCPPAYLEVPVFSCLFTHKNETQLPLNLQYTVQILSSDIRKRRFEVRVINRDARVEVVGKMRAWIPSRLNDDRGSAAAGVNNKSSNGPEIISKSEIREFVVESLKSDEKAQLIPIVKDAGGMVSLTIANRYQAKFNSLLTEFLEVCKEMPTLEKPGHQLVAVKTSSDHSWFRAVARPDGWALVDDGRIVPNDQVERVVVCPAPYSQFPFFSCVLSGVDQTFSEDVVYELTILSRDRATRTVTVMLQTGDTSFEGKLRPWVASVGAPALRFETPLGTVLIEADTLLFIVKFNNFSAVYVRLADDESNNKYMKHIDDLATFGCEASPLEQSPQPGDLVLCKVEQYYRAKFLKNMAKDECRVFLFDKCFEATVKMDDLRSPPPWVDCVPSPRCVHLRGLSETFMITPCFEYLKTIVSKKVVLKCKSFDESGIHLIQKKSMQDLNAQLEDISTPEWKRHLKQGKSLHSLEVGSIASVKYEPLEDKLLKVTNTDLLLVGAIYCIPQQKQTMLSFRSLTVQMTEYAESMPDPYMPRKNEICLYKDANNRWLRVCVMDAGRDDLVDLFSLDFGRHYYNIDYVNLRKLPLEFLHSHPASSSMCIINGLPDQLSPEAAERAALYFRENRIFTPVGLKQEHNTYIMEIPQLIKLLTDEGFI